MRTVYNILRKTAFLVAVFVLAMGSVWAQGLGGYVNGNGIDLSVTPHEFTACRTGSSPSISGGFFGGSGQYSLTVLVSDLDGAGPIYDHTQYMVVDLTPYGGGFSVLFIDMPVKKRYLFTIKGTDINTSAETVIAVIVKIDEAPKVHIETQDGFDGAVYYSCRNKTVTLKDVELDKKTFKYRWMLNNGDLPGEVLSSYTVPVEGRYKLAASSSITGCETASNTIEVHFYEVPQVSLTIPPVCDDATIELQASLTTTTVGDYTYNWSGPDSYTATATTTATSSTATKPNAHHPTNSGTYKVEVADANGCTAKATASITVDAAMNAGTINVSPARICGGAPVEITLGSTEAPSGGHGAASYKWEMSEGGGAWVDVPGAATDIIGGSVTLTLNANTKFRRVYTTDCGTVLTDVFDVVVDKPIAVNPGGPYAVCPEGTLNLAGSISGGVTTGVWSTVVGKGTLTGATYQPHADEAGQTIEFTLTPDSPADANYACPVAEAAQTVLVIIHDKGQATLNFPTEVCNSGTPFALDITPTGGNYSPIATTFDPTTYNPGETYTFNYSGVTDGNGCMIDQDITITVKGIQVFTVGGTTTVCGTDPVQVKLDGSEIDVNYALYRGSTFVETKPGTGSPLEFTVTETGTYTIKAEGVGGLAGCVADMSSSADIVLVPIITGNTIKNTGADIVCKNTSATGALVGDGTLGGGSGVYTYQWQISTDNITFTDIAGEINEDFTPGIIAELTYFRRIVKSGECSGESNVITIDVTPPPTIPNVSKAQTICYGEIPSMLTSQEPTGGTGSFTYRWEQSTDDNSWSPAVGVNDEQNYTPTVPLTDHIYFRRVSNDGACGDIPSKSIKITVKEELKVNITNSEEPKCSGEANGSLEAKAAGGFGDGTYTYTWSGPVSGEGAKLSGASKGTYTVVVKSDGCKDATTATDTKVLGEPTPIAANATPSDALNKCHSDKNGVIEVEVTSGGTPDYTFILGGTTEFGSSKATFNGLGKGTYTIEIKDKNGCPGSATATIGAPDQIEITTIDVTSPTCVGKSDGEIMVSASGGTGKLTYTVDGGSSEDVGNPYPTQYGEGIYTVKVTDENTCFVEDKATITNPEPVTFNPEPTPVTGCAGSTNGEIKLNISGGTGPYEYYSDQLGSTWTAVPVGNKIDGLAADDYAIKVRDDKFCESIEQLVTVTEKDPLSFTATPTAVKCFNSTNGEIAISEVKGGAGSGYKFTIAGAKTTNVHDGTVEYVWPDDFHDSKFEALEPDTYTLTLSDGSCTVPPQTVKIDAPAEITISSVDVGKVYCSNDPLDPKAKVRFTADGGSGNLTYHFMVSYYTGTVQKGLQTEAEVGVGTYDLMVKDEEGCSYTYPDPIEITLGESFRWVYAAPRYIDITNTSCAELADGAVTNIVEGGSGLYYYELLRYTPPVSEERFPDVGGTTEKTVTYTGLAKGEYQLYAYDINSGCIAIGEPFNIEGPEEVKIKRDDFEPIQCNGGDATFTVEATGGNGEYVIELYEGSTLVDTKTGSEPAVFTINAEGDYYAIVKDTKNCGNLTTSTHSVVNPAKVQFAATKVSDVTCAGGENGIIRISGLTGGNGEYWYSLNGADRVRVDDPSVDEDVKVGAGTWLVKVYDGNECPADAAFTIDITEPAPLKIKYDFDNPVCGTTGELKAILKGGSGSYEVSVDNSVWTDIVGNEYSFGNVGEGEYTLYLRDANDYDCFVSKDTTIETLKALKLEEPLALEQEPTCQQIGRLVVKTSGGMATVQYTLYEDVKGFVETNETGVFEVKDGGDYYVEITDGCTSIQSPEGIDRVHINQVPFVTIGSVDIEEPIKCKGDVAKIKVVVSGGTGELYYSLWDNSVVPAELIRENAPGENIFESLEANSNYMIIVRDGNGCEDTRTFAVDEPEAMLEWSKLEPVSPTGITKKDGYIHFKVKGGEAPYTATFTPDGEPSQTVTLTDSVMMFKFDNLGANVYKVVVTDARGCMIETSFVLQPVNVKHWGKHISCFGAADGKVYAEITGNLPYDIYLIDAYDMTVVYTDFVFESKIKSAPTGVKDTFVVSGIPAGVYDLYVGDKNSKNKNKYNVDIYEPVELKATIIDNEVPICATGGKGWVKIDVGGSRTYDKSHVEVHGSEPIYVIKWENTTTGETGEEQTNSEGEIVVKHLNPGFIKFTVTTDRGCGPKELTVDFPLINPITFAKPNVLQESSYGAGNGLIEVEASGDNPITQYYLIDFTTDKNGIEVDHNAIGLFSNVKEGKYVVRAEDDLGCPGYSDTIYIRGTDVVVEDITPVTCFGENQGAFKFHIEHGFPRFKSITVTDSYGETFAIEPVQDLYRCGETITVDGLKAGDYTVTIVDSTDYIVPHTFSIGQPDELQIVPGTITELDCSTNGEIPFSVVGGTRPYTSIQWGIDDGDPIDIDESMPVPVSVGGTYWIKVIDANNCPAEWDMVVAPAESIELAVNEKQNPSCYGGDNGRIEVRVDSDGTNQYQYMLEKDGTLINSSDNGLFENLSAGNYFVVIQNINTGCSRREPYILEDAAEPISITFDGFTGELDCPYDANGHISATVSGGNGNFTYIWPQLGETTSSVSGLTAGTYDLIVADESGCTATSSYTINGPKPFVFKPAIRTNAECRLSAEDGKQNGTLSVGALEGGTAPYSFYLVDETNHRIEANQPNFTGLGAGIYEVWAVDAHNCSYQYTDTVLINPANDFEIGVMDTTVCFANEVTLEAHMVFGSLFDQSAPLTYEWWSEANSASITPDAKGSVYHVEDLDVNVYRYKLRVSMDNTPKCYVEKWFDVGVYPKIDIHVPLYVSSVQNDTILSILFNQEYNVDVSTSTFDYNTSFEWKPSGVFTRGNSWNSSIFMTPEKYEELKETYPDRFKTLRDPQTKRDGDFFLVDVVATTDVGCRDSLTLYTKIVNKLYLANVFSPNGDGRNDIWKLPKEYLFPDLEIEIFNRWGALVWSAAGDKAARGWDGRTNNGKVLPIGTYWYVIKFNINSSEWKPLTGSVTIVK